MRIAELAPLWVSVPPAGYGGTERMVSALTEELVRRGHEVTLFAAGGSRTSARLVRGSPRPLWQMEVSDPVAYLIAQIEEVVRRSGDFDVIHSHVEGLPWLASARFQAPLVTTLHGRLDLPELRGLFGRFPEQPLVSISENQRRPLLALELNWVATIHHGLPLATAYRFGEGGGGYLAFVGRISAEKDPVTAIKVANRAGLPLKIASRVDPGDAEYFRTEVAPLLDHPLVEWLGEISEEAKVELLAEARALLLPIAWEEPFGLAFIEALGSGTPVITRPLGSAPELIVHGEHGYLVQTEDEMVEACRAIGQIDRGACRRWALDRFSVERMTDDYERVFEDLAAPKRSDGLGLSSTVQMKSALAG